MRSSSLFAIIAWLQCHVAGTRAGFFNGSSKRQKISFSTSARHLTQVVRHPSSKFFSKAHGVEMVSDVPARTTEGQILLGEVDIAVQGSEFDDITTEKAFTKKCVVNGNAYSHSQTIPSYDANSHCLCVAGEVYCWWQNYSPSTDPSAGPSLLPSTTIESNYTPSLEESTDADDSSEEAFGDPEQQGYVEINGTYSTTSQPALTTCLVMGREYREGEVLPHSTGNCIECSCGSEGRVECSPRDCVALRPEIPVAPNIPDAPDGDFEVFNFDRGIDESF